MIDTTEKQDVLSKTDTEARNPEESDNSNNVALSPTRQAIQDLRRIRETSVAGSEGKIGRRGFLKVIGHASAGILTSVLTGPLWLRRQPAAANEQELAKDILDRKSFFDSSSEVTIDGMVWKKQDLLSVPGIEIEAPQNSPMIKKDQPLTPWQFDPHNQEAIFSSMIRIEGDFSTTSGIGVGNGKPLGEGKEQVMFFCRDGQVYSRFENEKNLGGKAILQPLYPITEGTTTKVDLDLVFGVNELGYTFVIAPDGQKIPINQDNTSLYDKTPNLKKLSFHTTAYRGNKITVKSLFALTPT